MATPKPEGPEIGSVYSSVVQLAPGLWVGRRPELASIFDGEDRIHLDLEGRLHRAWLNGESYQRGLDGRVRHVRVGKQDSGQRWMKVEVLPGADAAIERVVGSVQRVAELARAQPDLPDEIRQPLDRARQFTPERYEEERRHFARVYRPIPILPPDQNRAVVIQVTEGCSYNRCSFCHLYRDVRFRMRPPAELREHVVQVFDLFGRALPLRRGVFLGQANALVVEQAKLVEAIGVIRGELAAAADRAGRAEIAGWPLAAFIDSFTRQKKQSELAELAKLGLDSVAVGLESGSAEVLEGLGKPLEVSEAVSLVERLHRASIRAGIIVLVGAGGRRLEREHVDATAAAINRMGLTRRDRVYLSPLNVIEGSEYARRMGEQELEALSPDELSEQAGELRRRLRASGVPAPIALYDIRRFIY